jgi:transposase
MSIEIETDRGNAMGLKGVGNQLEQRTILGTSEPMAKNDHRTLFSRFEYRLLKNGLQLSLRTINSYSFFYRMAT